jgi:hypothetical protein
LCCQLFIHDLNTKQWKQQLKNAIAETLLPKLQFVLAVTTAQEVLAPAVALAAPKQATGRRIASPGF